MNESPASTNGFDGLGIAPKLLAAIHSRGFTTPTPIQHQAIPVAIEGKDIIGIAQTGTGKTLAFGVPMIQRIGRGSGRGLVLLPTRELAAQVAEELHAIAGSTGLRTAVVIGGESEGRQLRQLKGNPHVVVATPGRLVDYLERGLVLLSDVHILVLDEADRMFDMGFAPQLRKILRAVPKNRQTMLFSATMPQEIVTLAKEHMGWPVRVEVAPSGTSVERVEQELFIVPKTQKLALLAQLLQDHPGTIILFSRTKYGARNIARKVRQMGHSGVEIHGNCTQAQRTKALAGFKGGTYRILIATDIAARGIDVHDVSVVLNYDLPMTAEDYVHRIGRTARAGKAGRAISFATPEQAKDVAAIERLIRKRLPRRPLPAHLPVVPIEERTEERPWSRRSVGGPRPPRGGQFRAPREGSPSGRGGPRGRGGVGRPGGRGPRGPRPRRTPYWAPGV